MTKLHIVGNPNSGKTTLFNSITKSSEHVGNWHGVTVDKKSKIIKFNDNEYELVDLPGIYSLNAYSLEEQVSIDEINSSDCRQILYLLDANNFKRAMLLALNLLINGKNIKILINNYKTFEASGGSIDTKYLQKILGCEVDIINAQKFKINQDFFKFDTRKTAFITMLANQINQNANNKLNHEMSNNEHDKQESEFNNQTCNNDKKLKNVEILYKYIIKISKNCVKSTKNTFGYSKLDKKLLKTSIYLPLFILLVVGVVCFTFFLVGPIISDCFLWVLRMLVQEPIMSILCLATKSKFFIALFEQGIFGACFSVLGFLPQICLMYLFLSILENSGLISRLAFLLDDILNKVGLNGKMVYTLLMGFGCSTTATLTSKNMPDKNSQIKVALLTPFISCSAKLPIYMTLGGAILGVKNIWLILGLYLLGIVMAIVFAIIFDRTILPSKSAGLIIEFSPLKTPSIKTVLLSIKTSCKQFVIKVFGVIFGASVIIWLLSNINIKFEYVADVSRSILYSFSCMISWLFKPLGLNNPSIICALLVGLVAKELILSTFAIFNRISNLELLGASLISASSAVNFSVASGISFLVFTLLYFPCVSNFGVLLKEVGAKFTLLGVSVQLILAYTTSYITYVFLSQSIVGGLVSVLAIVIILLGVKIIYKKIKSKKIFCNCLNCDKCNKT